MRQTGRQSTRRHKDTEAQARVYSSQSKREPQRELDLPRLVLLRIDLAERVVRGRRRGCIRLRKLNAIEKVERFGPELEARPLADGRPLREREVVVVDAVAAQLGIRPAGIAELERIRHGEACGVEPAIQSRLRLA